MSDLHRHWYQTTSFTWVWDQRRYNGAIPMTTNSTSRPLSWLIFVLAGGLLISGAAQSNQTPSAQPVPTIDGGVGPCSLELSVTTADGKPAAAASVKVHIAYGFGGFHKLDLEAGANVDGKVKFTGLPARVRRPPLEFQASSEQGQLAGSARFDPAAECHARRDIALAKATTSQQ